MNETHEMTFVVGASESDCFGRVRPSSLMHFIQEAAIGHTLALGIDRDVILEKLGAVWMILRARVELKRPVRYGDTLHIVTWAAPTQGPIWPREVELFVDGRSVGEVSTTWVVASIDTGRIVRPRLVLELGDIPTLPAPRFAPVDKVRPIAPLGEGETHVVRYSDLDMNRHVHNTRYLDLAADCIGMETLADRELRSFTISFDAQCVAGERLRIASATEGGRTYVRGEGEDGRARFEVEFLFEDRA